jgi:hypothetical protein
VFGSVVLAVSFALQLAEPKQILVTPIFQSLTAALSRVTSVANRPHYNTGYV